MDKPARDKRPLAVRLFVFQKERAPILAMLVMSALAVGVFSKFGHPGVWQITASILIICLYLIQIRSSDEKKDFEHDNRFHPHRPVQRGVVTLHELAVVNVIAIGLQLVLYASFLNIWIFALGLLSQGYAYLTRKEFFVRTWIRKHFYTYYVLHYIQLVILNLAILNIIRPNVPYWMLIVFVMLNIISVEVARKMLGTEDDTTDDTFSAQLGHKGSAATLSVTAILITINAYYFIEHYGQNPIYLALPVVTMGLVLNNAYHYSIEPDRKRAKLVEVSGALMLVGSMLGVILGA